ncbi:MAG: helix-turn-helix domain-containing protein [Thermoplasmata archaeon]
MTQEQMVINKLKVDGEISRNWALQNFCSRLGAIICKLKSKGWEFKQEYVKTKFGQDYRYSLTKIPFKKVVYEIPELNRAITSYE